MSLDSIDEKLADYSHKAWSSWVKYLFENGKQMTSGDFKIPKGLVQRWKRHMETPYESLSEEDQENDLEEANQMILIFKEHIDID